MTNRKSWSIDQNWRMDGQTTQARGPGGSHHRRLIKPAMATDFATVDYFSDQAIAQDPYEYLAYLVSRARSFRNRTIRSTR